MRVLIQTLKKKEFLKNHKDGNCKPSSKKNKAY